MTQEQNPSPQEDLQTAVLAMSLQVESVLRTLGIALEKPGAASPDHGTPIRYAARNMASYLDQDLFPGQANSGEHHHARRVEHRTRHLPDRNPGLHPGRRQPQPAPRHQVRCTPDSLGTGPDHSSSGVPRGLPPPAGQAPWAPSVKPQPGRKAATPAVPRT